MREQEQEQDALVNAGAILRMRPRFKEPWDDVEKAFGGQLPFSPEEPLVVATALHRTAAIAICLALADLEQHKLTGRNFSLVSKLWANHDAQMELLLHKAIELAGRWDEVNSDAYSEDDHP